MATFFMGETITEMSTDQLRAKIGELGGKAESLQIQIDSLKAQIANPPGGFWNASAAQVRLTALQDQQAAVIAEASTYAAQLKTVTGKDLTDADIAAFKGSSKSAEWMRQASAYKLTPSQIADIIKYGPLGRPPSGGGLSTKTLLIGGAAALALLYFTFK